MKFHRLTWKNEIDIVIMEPREREYVWLTFMLTQELRNGRISFELMKYLLWHFAGTHHTHFFPLVKTFSDAARLFKWKSAGKSNFFRACVAFTSGAIHSPPDMSPFFKVLLCHEVRKICPKLSTFKNDAEARLAVALIVEAFGRD